VLSHSDIEQIHRTSMRLLADVGVLFPSDEALAIFEAHGVATDGHCVYLREQQVMAAVDMVPKPFTIHARNPERSVVIGDGEPVFVPGYGAPVIADPDQTHANDERL